MIDDKLLGMLVCPQSHQKLQVAETATLEAVNQSIVAGHITQLGGTQMSTPLEAALVRQDGKMLYPIVDGIPNLVPDDAIDLSQLSGNSEQRDTT